MIDLSPQDGLRLAKLLADLNQRRATRLFDKLYPDETTTWPDGTVFHARHLYAKHLEHFEAGAHYRQRCAMAANRVGKTLGCGGYEVAVHATGRYPKWWTGRRFDRPVRIWAAGKTNETTRDIVQATLFGEITHAGGKKGFSGTGVVPGDTIGRPTWKQGVSDLADVVPVAHVSGGVSLVGQKSYQQGRGSFEGTAQHVIWLDEEPPRDVYGECLIRTATTDGIVILTFTPLEGLSETVLEFMPQDSRPGAA